MDVIRTVRWDYAQLAASQAALYYVRWPTITLLPPSAALPPLRHLHQLDSSNIIVIIASFRIDQDKRRCNDDVVNQKGAIWRRTDDELGPLVRVANVTILDGRGASAAGSTLYYISSYRESHRFHIKHVLIYSQIREKKGIGAKCNTIKVRRDQTSRAHYALNRGRYTPGRKLDALLSVRNIKRGKKLRASLISIQ